jgi:hypothetical protein
MQRLLFAHGICINGRQEEVANYVPQSELTPKTKTTQNPKVDLISEKHGESVKMVGTFLRIYV